jgi:hypothetical protein
MGKCRFLYNNLITSESMIAVSSLKLGVVSTALKSGTGSAAMTPSGAFTGAVDLEYVIEIDGLGTGEIGSSTFRWSDDGGATWDAATVATDDDPVALNNGVSVQWTAGTGADFVLGDKWYFKGVNLYNPGKMLDFDRDSRFRTLDATGAKTIAITFASQKPTALIIYDHNLTVGSTITLTGADGAKTVAWAADKILHYIAAADAASATWVLTITAAAGSYIEIGELFLGTYTELSKNFKEGYGEEPGFLMDTNITSYGIDRDRFYAENKTLSYEFSVMPSADLTLKRAFVTALGSGSTGIFKRFWFNANSATPADVILAKLIAWPHTNNTRDFYDMPLSMIEVLRSI